MSGGRKTLRDVTCQLGELSRADGSARYRHGRTEVLCSLIGPTEAPDRRNDPTRALIDVTVRGRASNVRSGGTSRVIQDMERYDEALSSNALAATVQGCMEAAVDVASLPRQCLSFTLQVLEDDGSLTSTCINAAMLALLDSGLACVTCVAAAEACSVGDSLIVDPSQADLAKAESTACFTHCTDEAGGMVSSEYVLFCDFWIGDFSGFFFF